MAARPEEGSFSQHPELYEWEAKREAEGRDRMRNATRSALLIGVLFAGLVFLMTGRADPHAGGVAAAIAGGLIGIAFYRWSHDSGFQMVVEAQRALVALETEQNTREIARLLGAQNSEATSADTPADTPKEQSQPADV